MRDVGRLQRVNPEPTASIQDVERAADTEGVSVNRVTDCILTRASASCRGMLSASEPSSLAHGGGGMRRQVL